MKESVLKSLMRLFAIVSQLISVEEVDKARMVVEKYLRLIVRKDKVRQYIIIYDFYHNSLREREIKTGDKQLSLFSVKTVIICEQVNREFDKKQKVFILAHILEILAVMKSKKVEDVDFVNTIAIALKLDQQMFFDCLSFIFDDLERVQNKNHVLVVDNEGYTENYKHIFKDFLLGRLVFLYLEKADICLFRHLEQDDQLYYNDQKIDLQSTYVFEEGGVVKSPLMGSLFYNDVLKVFLHSNMLDRVHYTAEKVSFRFPNSDAGIKTFTFSEESGKLLGIMGNSGVGKSTLLNLLNGNLKANSGRILINGYDLNEDAEKLQGIIGYIPQDDMLIEELTVFQNLYFSARLCFKKMSKDEIVRRVIRMLHVLGLSETKNLKVGSPLNKLISGGQRKRLNIALELIREPNILFVDEPTSGLSSTDSDIVMDLLKRQSIKGKLVVVNIHQPSSDIFKKMDKLLLLDAGGRVIFQGNPLNSLAYLKTYNQLINAEEGECSNCGNINPEQVLQIIESKVISEFGDFTSDRQVEADEWYQHYLKTQERDCMPAVNLKIYLPENEFSPPNKFNQFKIFSIRNVLSKLSNKQYLLINLLEAPVLALILGWFTRYNAGNSLDPEAYVFNLNSNLPVYIFMSVVVSIFLGLMVSAEEIIKDRVLLKREEFLHLNKRSYYNSKVVYLSLILAFQMLLFILVGNTILEIKGMYFRYWLMVWLSSLAAGTIGLNLSSTLKSVVAIYILIPLLIVPQILLGGAMIPFNKLNSKLTSPVYVPLSGDIMPSRWAYEGLAVMQFSDNKYQREIFNLEQKVSEASYYQNYFIPEVSSVLEEVKKGITQTSKDYKLAQNLVRLSNLVNTLLDHTPGCKQSLHLRDFANFNIALSQEVERFLTCSKETYNKILDDALNERDNKIYELEEKYGGMDQLVKLKSIYSNEQLTELVTGKNEFENYVYFENNLVQLSDPIYKYPLKQVGRSHLFAPAKRVGNVYIQSYWFNVLVLLGFIITFYLCLVFEVFQKWTRIMNRRSVEWLLKGALRTIKDFRPMLRKTD